MTASTLHGSCLCGTVQYEISGEPKRFYHCHCRRCRKATGTGHASNIILESGTMSWLRGEDQLGRYRVPDAERFATCFCKTCGSPLPRFTPETGRAVIPAGSLDDVPDIKPQARIFQDSRVEWSCRGDDMPGFAEYPPNI